MRRGRRRVRTGEIGDVPGREFLAIVALLAGVFVALTLIPWDITGPTGRVVGRKLWFFLGCGAAVLPLIGVGAALAGFGRLGGLGAGRVVVLLGGLVLLAPFAVAVITGASDVSDFPPSYDDWELTQRLVGIVPAAVAVTVSDLVGTAGAVILGVLALSALTLYTVEWHPFRRLRGAGERKTAGRENGRTAKQENDRTAAQQFAIRDPQSAVRQQSANRNPQSAIAAPSGPPAASAAPLREVGSGEEELPPLDLLHTPSADEWDAGEEELERLGHVLIDTLATFRVDGAIVGRTTGPVVTQYEVAPGPGVKVGRIAALADDLALAMRAPSIRIVAPIPGKAAVGVEVPNPTPRIVMLRELLESPEWDRSRGLLPIALGRNLEGRPIVADLARMPHLLVAGTTGSGKSVCINAIITSLVYRYTPRELRMLLIDPKMVELSVYNALPHLRHPVVTDNREAAQALKWVMLEMERRYELFHANGARNIHDFNRRVAEGKPLYAERSPLDAGAHRAPRTADSGQEELSLTYDDGPLPYVILIIDELADLMMTVQGDVERPLAILAQKARATGLHLVLATQRPSVNVITGLIKANFPCRIAFRVASKVDSRTILDQNGAETLLGNGDMLFLPPGRSEPLRVQGAYVSTDEAEALMRWYSEREAARAARDESDILEVVQAVEAEEAGIGGGEGGAGTGERDLLFREAAEICIAHQLGSTSLLQRKLRIGYGRAARIIDQLHEAGVLGPPDGSKPREVLIDMSQVDEYCE